jgi:hypothetical protein
MPNHAARLRRPTLYPLSYERSGHPGGTPSKTSGVLRSIDVPDRAPCEAAQAAADLTGDEQWAANLPAPAAPLARYEAPIRRSPAM